MSCRLSCKPSMSCRLSQIIAFGTLKPWASTNTFAQNFLSAKISNTRQTRLSKVNFLQILPWWQAVELRIFRRVLMWKLEIQPFASSLIWLAYIFEASYSTVVTSVSKKSSIDQPELEIGGISLSDVLYVRNHVYFLWAW